MMTPAEREAFLRGRTAVGASEVAAVMGLSSWRTPADVYVRLVMLLDHGRIDEADPENSNMLRGVLLEDAAVQLFCDTTGARVRRVTKADVAETMPWLRSNPDRIILSDEDHEVARLLEVKCPRPEVIRRIRQEGLNSEALVQVQAQLLMRPRMNECVVWIFDSVDPLRSFSVTVQRDVEYGKLIDEALSRFWYENLTVRKMPTEIPEYRDPESDYVRQLANVESNTALAQTIEAYAAIVEAEAELKEKKDELRKVLEDATVNLQAKRLKAGDITVTMVHAKGRSRLLIPQLQVFCLEHGKTLSEFEGIGSPYSFLKVTKKRKEARDDD